MTRFSFTIALVLFALSSSIAQKRVDAQEIISLINQGKPVRYENVEISGELDLTNLVNRKKERSDAGLSDNNNAFKSTVENKLTFINCTFLDDVIAYYHNDREDKTFIADFEDDIVFQNCTFREASEFKYSQFSGKTNFQGTVFEEEANFKYAEFSEAPIFSHVVFEDHANFKYAKFPENINFTAAVFNEEANFKYADFPSGTNFENVVFNGLANFKYAKFSTPLNMSNVSFNGSEDFKYTKVDGKNFTSYLLTNKK